MTTLGNSILEVSRKRNGSLDMKFCIRDGHAEGEGDRHFRKTWRRQWAGHDIEKGFLILCRIGTFVHSCIALYPVSFFPFP